MNPFAILGELSDIEEKKFVAYQYENTVKLFDYAIPKVLADKNINECVYTQTILPLLQSAREKAPVTVRDAAYRALTTIVHAKCKSTSRSTPPSAQLKASHANSAAVLCTDDILVSIFSLLEISEYVCAMQCCKTWRRLRIQSRSWPVYRYKSGKFMEEEEARIHIEKLPWHIANIRNDVLACTKNHSIFVIRTLLSGNELPTKIGPSIVDKQLLANLLHLLYTSGDEYLQVLHGYAILHV